MRRPAASAAAARRPSHLCTFAGHILEHSEDDTKSLFVIIKVCEASCGLLLRVEVVSRRSSLQIISDLLFFRGTHRSEFDSRWKSFTLVKKSLENRVSLDARPAWDGRGRGLMTANLSCSFTGRSSTSGRSSSTACCCSTR